MKTFYFKRYVKLDELQKSRILVSNKACGRDVQCISVIFILTVFASQLNKLVALVNAVFAKQGRKFKKDEKILAYPSHYYSRLFNFYDNMTRT